MCYTTQGCRFPYFTRALSLIHSSSANVQRRQLPSDIRAGSTQPVLKLWQHAFWCRAPRCRLVAQEASIFHRASYLPVYIITWLYSTTVGYNKSYVYFCVPDRLPTVMKLEDPLSLRHRDFASQLRRSRILAPTLQERLPLTQVFAHGYRTGAL